jgi:hypothetical protein
MASPSSAEHRLPVVVNSYADDEASMPAGATRTLLVLASGFGIGALIVLFGFVFLVGIGDIGHNAVTPATPAAQSAANAPAAPGPAPKPVPNTSGSAVPETTGQAPAPASSSTPKAPTAQQLQQRPQ